MDILDSNTLEKINLLAKRDIERKVSLQKRKETKNNLIADNEKLSFFETTFLEHQLNINNLLSKSQEIEKSKLADHFNDISKEILQLQKYVAASNIFLRTYDIKKCQESLSELTSKSREIEQDLLPKKKFGFKNRSKATVSKKEPAKDVVDLAPKIFKSLCGFANLTGVELQMQNDQIYKKDVTAENLVDCTVKFFGSPSTLHLNGLENCYVFTGPVSTSIFANNCVNCTLVIACQQLRLHSSHNVNIYLHVTSRAIMEDCKGINIAPYNWSYEGLDSDFQASGLDQHANNWRCIDDFNWLNVEKQSPNWTILESVQNWD